MSILIASEVMDSAAAVLNDANKTVYDYDTQLPYLKLALQELSEVFALNSLPVTEKTSGTIPIANSALDIEFNAIGSTRLPDNLLEIQQVWEWIGNYWTPVGRRNWTWDDNKFHLFSSYVITSVKLDYIGSLFPKYLRSDTILPVQNAFGYLSYKTAELIADQIEHNMERAKTNAGRAEASLDRINGITIKNKQRIMVRRRPFRSAYKRTGAF